MECEDIIIIGSGPAAYSAALFARSKRTLVFEGGYREGMMPGGQLTTTTDVDNYPGFPTGIQGPDLMDAMRKQATDSGIRIISRFITSIKQDDSLFILYDNKKEYRAKSVIIATGASAKRLYVPGTKDGELWQRGISACAICDGFAFKDKEVAVIGGGDSAMEEALYLSKIASKVYIIHRRNEFRARGDKIEKARSTSNIEIITPIELVSAHGDKKLEYIKLINNESKNISDLKLDGLFFGIGHIPNTQFLNGLVELREDGYISTDELTHTSVRGIFACGDVQDHYYRQAVTAAASGCLSAQESLKYLDQLTNN